MIAIVAELIILAALLVRQKAQPAHGHRHRRLSRHRRRTAGLDWGEANLKQAHRNRRPGTH